MKLLLVIWLASALCRSVRADEPLWIGWKPLEGAIRFELEVRGSKIYVYRKKLPEKQLKWTRNLPPGAYIFRLRGVDAFDRPGAWAEGPTQVTLARPHTHPTDTSGYKPGDSVKLEWDKVEGAEKYQLWIWKAEKLVETKTISGNDFQYEPVSGGEYEWSVAAAVEDVPKFDTPREMASGLPSEKRSFRIVSKAARQIASVSKPAFEVPSLRIGFDYFSNHFESAPMNSSFLGHAFSKGVGGGVELNLPIVGRLSSWTRLGIDRYEIDSWTLTRESLDLLLKFQFLGERRDQKFGLSFYTGTVVRKHNEIQTDPALSYFEPLRFGTLGIGIGLQGYFSFSRQWRLRARVGYSFPLVLLGTRAIYLRANNFGDNHQVDLTGEYFLSDRIVFYLSPSWSADEVRYSSTTTSGGSNYKNTVLKVTGGVRLVF